MLWPLGLRDVEAPTLLRQTANRWRQGCQPYAPDGPDGHSLGLFFFVFNFFHKKKALVECCRG
jgi:hypothetical protein